MPLSSKPTHISIVFVYSDCGVLCGAACCCSMEGGELTAIAVKVTVVWDVTPCSLVRRYQLFGGSSCRHLQGTLILHPDNGGREFFQTFGTYLRNHTGRRTRKQ